MPVKFLSGIHLMTTPVLLRVMDNPAFAGFVEESTVRHLNGDWGELSAEDKAENERALKEGLRLFSAYEKEEMPRIWIVTEADRSVTTVSFPEDY